MEFIKEIIETKRLKTAYIRMGDKNKETIVFVHGNVSSSEFFVPLMHRLKDNFDLIAIDMNGFGKSEGKGINSKTGIKDWSDDLDSFITELNIEKFTLCGWSLGGGVAMQYAIDYNAKLNNLVLISPLSPFGFGGTKDACGTLVGKDGIGYAGGAANAGFVKALYDKDTSSDNPNGIISVINNTYFKPPFKVTKDIEDMLVEGILQMKLGEDYYPGNFKQTELWPYILPSDKGILNTMSPVYCNLSGLSDIENKINITWVKGEYDIITSNNSMCDLPFLGSLGYLPNYPGKEEFPWQPMNDQIKYVLDNYQSNGGCYDFFELKDCGHSCFIEKEDDFVTIIKNLKF